MKPQTFASLALAAVVALGLAITLYAARGTNTTAANGGKLMPDLAANADKVQKIEIAQGTAKIALERTGNGWRLADHDGYPADTDKVRALLVGLSEAELTEAKTRNKDRFPMLAVEDQSDNANARLIRILAADGSVIAETIAGKSRAEQTGSGTGTYVRKPGDTQAWLASTPIVGGASLRDWTQARIFETPTEKISKLTIEVAGEPAYDIKRDGDQQVLADIPAGKKIKYMNATDLIVEAASFLDFEDVRKASGDTTGAAGQATLESDGGLKITMKLRRDKDATWATLDVAGDGDAKKAADDIRSKAAGWEFKVLPSKVQTILKKKADLLEDAPS